MDGGIEQNPAYGMVLIFDLQGKHKIARLEGRNLTPRFTPTGLLARYVQRAGKLAEISSAKVFLRGLRDVSIAPRS